MYVYGRLCFTVAFITDVWCLFSMFDCTSGWHSIPLSTLTMTIKFLSLFFFPELGFFGPRLQCRSLTLLVIPKTNLSRSLSILGLNWGGWVTQ